MGMATGRAGADLLGAAVLWAVVWSASPAVTRADEPANQSVAQTQAVTAAPHPSAETRPFENNLTGDWGGARKRLQDAGVSIGGTLTLEGFYNFMGGVDTAHAVGATTVDVNATLDLDKLIHLPGGTFYVDLENHGFRNPTTALVGDLQVFDKQNSTPYLQVFELWYQQQLFDGKVRIKIGKVDANTEFSVIDNGLPFISSSTQVTPTLYVFPTTPDPMPSIDVFFTPNDTYFADFGASYANRSDRFGDLIGNPAAVQPTQWGTFLIGETGVKWRTAPGLGLGGNFKVGAWGHTGAFTRFNGTQQDGGYGLYGILNQTLWQAPGEPESARGVRAFLEYGYTEDNINPVDQHVGGGITWTGPFAARPDDVVGFTPQYAHISPKAGLPYSYELALETFYQYQIAPWAVLQPDLQYIIHPGGLHPNALVATLRLQISF